MSTEKTINTVTVGFNVKELFDNQSKYKNRHIDCSNHKGLEAIWPKPSEGVAQCYGPLDSVRRDADEQYTILFVNTKFDSSLDIGYPLHVFKIPKGMNNDKMFQVKL